MTTQRKLASLATVPAVFVGAFAAAFLAIGVADALAQPAGETPTTAEEQPTPTETGSAAEKPPYGYAPPSDDAPGMGDAADPAHGSHEAGATAGAHGAEGAHEGGHGGGHGDPSKHFNFFNFGYSGKDVVGGPYGDGKNFNPETGEAVAGEEEKMSAPFVLMIVNFLILMGLLAWKGGPIVRKLAAERHDQIKDALDEAAKLRQQAADKLAEYETKLKAADDEIKTMVEGLRKDAETDKARILENAERQAAQMKRDAELRIAAEIEFARAALTREVTAAAASATEKLLRDKMMPADQQKLVASFITDVQAQSTGQAKENA